MGLTDPRTTLLSSSLTDVPKSGGVMSPPGIEMTPLALNSSETEFTESLDAENSFASINIVVPLVVIMLLIMMIVMLFRNNQLNKQTNANRSQSIEMETVPERSSNTQAHGLPSNSLPPSYNEVTKDDNNMSEELPPSYFESFTLFINRRSGEQNQQQQR